MPKIPILTYHSIDNSSSVISTAPATFKTQMKYLSDNGYQSMTVGELSGLLKGEAALPAKTVVLTFDDGFQNFYTEAFGVLEDHNLTATVFLVTDYCGKQNDWSGNPPNLPRSKLLSWREVRELADRGIEFGSHTRTHPDLTRIEAAAVDDEVLTSKAIMSDKLGRETLTFAYPFGRSNSVVQRKVKANYQAACSTNLGKTGSESDLSALNRLDAYYLVNPRIFERLSTAAFDGYMSFRQAGRTLKALLAGG